MGELWPLRAATTLVAQSSYALLRDRFWPVAAVAVQL